MTNSIKILLICGFLLSITHGNVGPRVEILDNKFICTVTDRDLNIRIKCPLLEGYCFENCLAYKLCESEEEEDGPIQNCIPKSLQEACSIERGSFLKKLILHVNPNDPKYSGDWQCEQKGIKSKKIHITRFERFPEEDKTILQESDTLTPSTKQPLTTLPSTTNPPQSTNTTALPMESEKDSDENLQISGFDLPIKRNKEKQSDYPDIVKFLLRIDVIIPILVALFISIMFNCILSIRWCLSNRYKLNLKQKKPSECLRMCLCRDPEDTSIGQNFAESNKNAIFLSPGVFYNDPSPNNINNPYRQDSLSRPLIPNSSNNLEFVASMNPQMIVNPMRSYNSMRVSTNSRSQPALVFTPKLGDRNISHCESTNTFTQPGKGDLQRIAFSNTMEAKRNFFKSPTENKPEKTMPTYDDIASTTASFRNQHEYYIETDINHEPFTKEMIGLYNDEETLDNNDFNSMAMYKRDKLSENLWTDHNTKFTGSHDEDEEAIGLLDKADMLLKQADKLIPK